MIPITSPRIATASDKLILISLVVVVLRLNTDSTSRVPRTQVCAYDGLDSSTCDHVPCHDTTELAHKETLLSTLVLACCE